VICTLIGSAKRGGIDPQACLRHVLERIADHPIHRIGELLPRVVAPQLHAAWYSPAANAARRLARTANIHRMVLALQCRHEHDFHSERPARLAAVR